MKSVKVTHLSAARLGGMAVLFGAIALNALEAAKTNANEWTLKGSTQFLAMGRDFGGANRGNSGSVSVTVDAGYSISESLSLGGQLVHAQRLWESDPQWAYKLSNDTATSLNELYAAFEASPSASIKLGRQIVDYDFFPTYKIRHKAQAIEALVVKSELADGLSLDLGHIERYSAWPSREGAFFALDSSFRDFSDRNDPTRAPGGDDGVQFVSAKWDVDKSLSITAYDYYAGGFYNNLGLKGVYSFAPNSDGSTWSASGHFIKQDGNGVTDQDAFASELNLRYKKGSLTLDTGWTHIANDDDLQVPFRTSFVIDTELLWYTNQYDAGTDSLHFKGTYKFDRWSFVGIFVEAEHANGDDAREFDLIVKRTFENSVWAAFKGGYGDRELNGVDQHASDLRLFVGYDF